MRRWVACTVVVAGIAMWACGDGASPQPVATVTVYETVLPTQPAVSPTTAPSPESTDTTGASSPQDAARGLYDRWQDGDEAGALEVATPATVSELFGYTPSVIEFTGCTERRAQFLCSFIYEGGALSMTVEGDPTAGYLVVRARFIAD